MMQQSAARICLACSKALKGRSDKKFCNDYCRNVYNNRLKSEANNAIRNINNVLRRNRRILAGYLAMANETAKTTRERLLAEGFRFTYYTHVYTNKSGGVYYFCYDIGYLPLENNWYLVVRRKRITGPKHDRG